MSTVTVCSQNQSFSLQIIFKLAGFAGVDARRSLRPRFDSRPSAALSTYFFIMAAFGRIFRQFLHFAGSIVDRGLRPHFFNILKYIPIESFIHKWLCMYIQTEFFLLCLRLRVFNILKAAHGHWPRIFESRFMASPVAHGLRPRDLNIFILYQYK